MDIETIRNDINSVDEELVGCFQKRMALSRQIAECKKESKLPVFDRSRERDILNHVSELAGKDLEGYVRVLYSTLFDVSRSYQHQLIGSSSALRSHIAEAIEKTDKLFPERAVVACQGVEGAYSQSACDKLFTLPNIMYFNSFQGVFQAVEAGFCRYGILPIENSTAGSVNEVYDLMKKHNFSIVRSIKLRIDHNLLAKKGSKISDIKEIFSHQQALSQCSEFIKSLKDVKVTVCENTATAARFVAESGRGDVAAISSQNCAELNRAHDRKVVLFHQVIDLIDRTGRTVFDRQNAVTAKAGLHCLKNALKAVKIHDVRKRKKLVAGTLRISSLHTL